MLIDVDVRRLLMRAAEQEATPYNSLLPVVGMLLAVGISTTHLLCSVIAIDVDPVKIALAKHNAAVYGVAERIDFRVGDICTVLPQLHADVVFVSPPWGGPDYRTQERCSLHQMYVGDWSVAQLFRAARRVTRNVALFLPRNIDRYELEQLVGQGNLFEIEQNRYTQIFFDVLSS